MPTMPVTSMLEQFLSLTTKREGMIASNMANVDTPGYRTQDMDFQRELSKAMDQTPGGQLQVTSHTVNGLMQRPDGNDVDMDRESMLLSESQLQFQFGTQLLKHQFHEMLSAINGDK